MKEIIKKWLEKKKWAYMENESVLKLDVTGKNNAWSSFIKADENDCFSYFSVLPTRVPEERINFLLELVNRVNCKIWFGSFELMLDEGRGQIRLRTSAIIPETAGEEITDTVIEGTLGLNMAIMNAYISVFTKAIYSDSDRAEEFIR